MTVPHPSEQPADLDEKPTWMTSEKAKRVRATAERKGANAMVWMMPGHRMGAPCVGSLSNPVATEAVKAKYLANHDAAATATFFGITVAAVWAAIWFELGMDSRRRFWF